jgi:hypothetical protein
MVVSHPWSYAKDWEVFTTLGLDNAGLSPEEISAERAKFAKIAKLVLDTGTDDPGPYSAPLSAEDNEASATFLRDIKAEQRDSDNAFPVPYTTLIHNLHTSLPWSRLLISSAQVATSEERLRRHVQHERPVFASYVTSEGRLGQPPETEYLAVKRRMLAVCVKAPECRVHVVDPGRVEKSFKRVVQHIEDKASVVRELGFEGLHDLVESSKGVVEFVHYLSQFCLMPPGDTVSRKGLFDAIVMGCIPVVFYPGSAYYPWHLPVGDGPDGLESFSVYIPAKEVLKNHTIVMDHLRSIPKQRVRAMQEQLAALAPRIQYTMTLDNEPGMNWWDEQKGRAPDALDVSLAGLLMSAKRQKLQ